MALGVMALGVMGLEMRAFGMLIPGRAHHSLHFSAEFDTYTVSRTPIGWHYDTTRLSRPYSSSRTTSQRCLPRLPGDEVARR
jgi:hypothetical protein